MTVGKSHTNDDSGLEVLRLIRDRFLPNGNRSNLQPRGTKKRFPFSPNFPLGDHQQTRVWQFDDVLVIRDFGYLRCVENFFECGKRISVVESLHDEIVRRTHLFKVHIFLGQGFGIAFVGPTLQFLYTRKRLFCEYMKAEVSVSVCDCSRAASNLEGDKTWSEFDVCRRINISVANEISACMADIYLQAWEH